jgi:hypothetical protein
MGLLSLMHSGDQPAFEQFIGYRSRNLVDECGTHLRIVVKKFDRFYLLRTRWRFSSGATLEARFAL